MGVSNEDTYESRYRQTAGISHLSPISERMNGVAPGTENDDTGVVVDKAGSSPSSRGTASSISSPNSHSTPQTKIQVNEQQRQDFDVPGKNAGNANTSLIFNSFSTSSSDPRSPDIPYSAAIRSALDDDALPPLP